MVDEILMNETKKISSLNHEALEFSENDYDENDLYQVENLSLDETKEKWTNVSMHLNKKAHTWWKKNKMIYMHDNEVNNIAEWYLLHDITNPPKHAKNINSHYSPIFHGCINIRKS